MIFFSKKTSVKNVAIHATCLSYLRGMRISIFYIYTMFCEHLLLLNWHYIIIDNPVCLFQPLSLCICLSFSATFSVYLSVLTIVGGGFLLVDIYHRPRWVLKYKIQKGKNLMVWFSIILFLYFVKFLYSRGGQGGPDPPCNIQISLNI